MRDSVVKPGDSGFLAAVLKPGMRAVTVGVNVVLDDDDFVVVNKAPGYTQVTNPNAQIVAAEIINQP